MKAQLGKSGFGFSLRLVQEDDAEFILRLRAMPHVRGTVGDTVPDVESQLRWMRDYFVREGDYYFIIEGKDGVPVGTVALYNLKERSAEWGRWIILPGAAAALPSAALIHQIAFDELQLTELLGCVVSTNVKVLSFHRRFGAQVSSIERQGRQINGAYVDLVWFSMGKDTWISRSEEIFSMCGFFQ